MHTVSPANLRCRREKAFHGRKLNSVGYANINLVLIITMRLPFRPAQNRGSDLLLRGTKAHIRSHGKASGNHHAKRGEAFL